MLPDWTSEFALKGCEIKCINGNYYRYKRECVWDPVKKRPTKKTGEYLGAITPDGFKPKGIRIKDGPLPPSLEYGASAFIMSISDDIRNNLHEAFNNKGLGDTIYVMSILRVLGENSFKRMEEEYLSSYMSESIPGININKSNITDLLIHIGNSRVQILEFMNNISKGRDNLIIDGSKITTRSQQMELAEVGYNPNHVWDPQVNVVYMFERAENPEPILYRCVPGNIPDVKAMQLTIESLNRESKITIVGDTNFGSNSNLKYLEENNISYVVPLKRNTNEISLDTMKVATDFEDIFTYNDKPVLFHEVVKKKYRLIVFKNIELCYKEYRDHVARIQKKNNEEDLKKKKTKKPRIKLLDSVSENESRFGILVIKTTMEGNAEEIYATYKQRMSIEQCFDTLKNTLNQDRSYMHSDTAFEAWCFINHISLILGYRILNTLKRNNLLKTNSLKDVTAILSKIRKSKINGIWRTHETTKKVMELVKKLNFNI